MLLKVENASNGGIFFEKEDTVSVANTWEELTFDYSAIDVSQQYSKIVFIFDLGVMGDGSANFTFLFDDIELVAGSGGSNKAQISLPVTFDDTANVDYSLTDFGGNYSSPSVADPAGGTNLVAMTTKGIAAQFWSGTTMGPASGTGFPSGVPFTATETKMTAWVYAPNAGIPVRLKVEDATDPTKSVETEDTTTVANTWEMLEFDFSNPVMGTAGIDLNNTYDKGSFFFHFGADGMMAGADTVFYWDNVEFVGGAGSNKSQIDLPVTFDDTANVDYSLTDFGGNYSSPSVADPAGGTNLVAMSTKGIGAQFWSGTTMGPASGTGFATPVPFTATETKMTAWVYAPNSGIPVRFKVEDATDPTKSVETEDTTTVANTWEMLEFDFSNPVMGTAGIDLNNTYDKGSFFFHFGADGMMAGADTVFYWDNVEFVGGGGSSKAQIDLPVTFDDTANVDYSLTDFGGNYSSPSVADPAGGTNLVAMSTKGIAAQFWSGTTMGPASGTGFATPVPFTATETKMTAWVYAPNAGIPVRLKVEDATDPTKSVETEDTTTVANTWEMLEFDFSNPVMGTAGIDLNNTYDKGSFFFHFGADGMMAGADTVFYWDNVEFVGGGGSGKAQIDLPVTFDDTANVDYSLTDFGGNYSSPSVADPAGGTNLVAMSTKGIAAQFWSGTTMGPASGTGFANPVPFTATETKMTAWVYSPSAGIPVRMKVEDATDPTKSVETEDTTTVANTWEMLEFDFSNPVMGTAGIDLNNTYDKGSFFFHFGADGMMAGADTVFYWDNVEFVGGGGSGKAQIDLPVTFDDTANVDYSLTDFGGNYSSPSVADPAGGTNLVAMSTKSITAQLWAGTTMGPASGTGYANAIPFTAMETKMSVRVYAPNAGIPVRLKVEDATDPTISVETEATTTMGNAWETLEFDFSNEVMGTAALDLNNTYDKGSIFFYFGTDGMMAGADTVFYWDDVQFGSMPGPSKAQIDLPVTFDDTANVDYSLTDFGGNYSSPSVADPAGGTNLVAMSTKSIGAQVWSGTTMGPASGTGYANAIPFTAMETKMSVRVYAPNAGIPVRLKVEDATDPTISVETEATTTMGNAWETLEFDFSNEVMGTAALDLNNTYDKGSIFFYFGTDGMMAGADTVFYWDDVQFGGVPGPSKAQIDLPVTFEDTANVDYSLTDFGGTYSSHSVVDPTGGTNLVAMSTKSITSQVWAGTTMGPASGTGFANPIPFTAMETKMIVRVYAPAAGIPVRLKVEDATDPSISVETEDTTTMANTWEILEFDFSNEVMGTAALDLANTYDKASIFFHFGTDGMSIGADSVYYWDDVEFGSAPVSIDNLEELGLKYYPNPVRNTFHMEAREQISEVMVFNQMGQMVRRIEGNTNNNIALDMTGLRSGVYVIRVKTADTMAAVKVVKIE